MAYTYIVKHARLRPPRSHNLGLQLSIFTLALLQPPTASPNWLNYCLEVYLHTRSISVFKLIWSWPSSASNYSLYDDAGVHPPGHLIMTLNCISIHTLLPLQSAFPNSFEHGLRVYLSVHSLVIFRGTMNVSAAPPAASPDTLCVDG